MMLLAPTSFKVWFGSLERSFRHIFWFYTANGLLFALISYLLNLRSVPFAITLTSAAILLYPLDVLAYLLVRWWKHSEWLDAPLTLKFQHRIPTLTKPAQPFVLRVGVAVAVDQLVSRDER